MEPTAEEVAAIVAAIEVSWPRVVLTEEPQRPSPWLFSNRWWLPRRPVAVNRQRP